MRSATRFFNDYASALLTYDAEKIAGFYQVPMAVYSDQGVLQVTKMKEVVDFWKEGIQPYKKSGIVKSVPEIVSEEKLSKNIFLCKVSWKNYNENNTEVAAETNVYILHQVGAALKISGLIIMAG